MRLSSKTDYALKTLIDLGLHPERKVTKVSEIASRHGIPQKFLAQILLSLKGAGIVGSRRGAKGGYFLVRSPKDITVAHVMQLTEDSFPGLSNASEAPRGAPPSDVILHDFRNELNEYVRAKLESVTLEALCQRAREAARGTASNYVI